MKIFMIFGFILLAMIVAFSFTFTQNMYQSAAMESNNTSSSDEITRTASDINYSWAFIISFILVVFSILLVFGLLFV